MGSVGSKGPPSGCLPVFIGAVDPDSTSSAVATARLAASGDRYEFVAVEGGGSQRVTWQDVFGVGRFLDAAPCELSRARFAVESQPPKSPYSVDVEELRRVRYHWEAACLLRGVGCVFVPPIAWLSVFVPDARGSVKTLYRAEAKRLTPQATNEDRAAAVGILCWLGASLGASIDFGEVEWKKRASR